jgi:hypothetical protein
MACAASAADRVPRSLSGAASNSGSPEVLVGMVAIVPSADPSRL